MAETGTPEAASTGTSGSASGAAGRKLREEASKLGGQAAERARAYASDGKERATGALDEFSKMLQDAAGSVDERLGAEYGKYARSAADSVAGFAEQLRGKQVDELLDDAAQFVKKSPAVAVGVAAAVGFVLARLVKSGLDAPRDDTPPADKG